MQKGNCMDFQFLAANEFKGLEKFLDGILGMSAKSQFLWKLKESGQIKEPVVSFSLVS